MMKNFRLAWNAETKKPVAVKVSDISAVEFKEADNRNGGGNFELTLNSGTRLTINILTVNEDGENLKPAEALRCAMELLGLDAAEIGK